MAERKSGKATKKVEEKKKNVSQNAKSSQKTTVKAKPKSVSVKKNVEKVYEPKNIKISGFHELQLNTYLYENVKNPKAVVVVVHGMQEHCMRYRDFANFLNKNGYIVICSDLRGHGHTAESKEKLGFGEKDIFNETIADQINIIDFAKRTYGLPIYLFGHSYGSMLGQVLIQKCPFIEKAVLCGTTNGSSFIMKMGGALASVLSIFKKNTSKGGLIEKACISSYGKGFDRGNWLSRDESNFDRYLADEYCGGTFPFGFYKSMIKNMNKANRGIERIGDKKVFLIAGNQDPVGEKSKQVKKLYRKYLKANVDAQIKIYDGARHELLNETNKKEVFDDVLKFFDA